MRAIAEDEVSVGQVEGPRIFAVKTSGIMAAAGDDLFETRGREVADEVGGETVDAPDSRARLEESREVRRVGDILFRRDKKLDPVFGEVEGDSLDRDDFAIRVGEILFGKGGDFFERSRNGRSAEDRRFESSISRVNPRPRVPVVAVASADENGSVAVLDYVSSAEPVAGAALERLDEKAGGSLIHEGRGESGEFFGLNGGENGHGG